MKSRTLLKVEIFQIDPADQKRERNYGIRWEYSDGLIKVRDNHSFGHSINEVEIMAEYIGAHPEEAAR